jgi:hypothetical protein
MCLSQLSKRVVTVIATNSLVHNASAVEAGRPIKLDYDKIRLIAQVTRAGGTREAAAGVAGVHCASLFRWLARGQALADTPRDQLSERDRLFVDLAFAVNEAEAMLEVKLLRTWVTAASSDWRASSTLLSRRFPQRWSEHRTLSVGQRDAEVLELLEQVFGGEQEGADEP